MYNAVRHLFMNWLAQDTYLEVFTSCWRPVHLPHCPESIFIIIQSIIDVTDVTVKNKSCICFFASQDSLWESISPCIGPLAQTQSTALAHISAAGVPGMKWEQWSHYNQIITAAPPTYIVAVR